MKIVSSERNNAIVSTDMQLSTQERIARLRLFRSENVGPTTFYHLMRQYSSAENALDALPSLAFRGGRTNPLRVYSYDAALKEIEDHEKYGAKFLIYGDYDYPKSLIKLGDATPVLSVKGNVALLKDKPIIAMVGARNASLAGKKMAQEWAYEFGKSDYTITSGLARGIDTAAHKGSIETGTIAVIAGGINQIYPSENRSLYEEIAEKGLLIAESAFNVEPQASLFPRRNRLISALSQAVVVIEAAQQSGSLITARFAADQNRDVFVVPGSPLDVRYGGSNKLIKEGASVITSPQDLLESLNRLLRLAFYDSAEDEGEIFYEPQVLDNHTLHVTSENIHELEELILSELSLIPIPLDDIVRLCKVDTNFVMTRILELELAGRVLRHPNNKISIIV